VGGCTNCYATRDNHGDNPLFPALDTIVPNRPEDFVVLGRLMDLVKPMMDFGPRNELVLYSAFQSYRILQENRDALKAIAQQVSVLRPQASLMARLWCVVTQ